MLLKHWRRGPAWVVFGGIKVSEEPPRFEPSGLPGPGGFVVCTTQPRRIDVTVNRQGAAWVWLGLGQAACSSLMLLSIRARARLLRLLLALVATLSSSSNSAGVKLT